MKLTFYTESEMRYLAATFINLVNYSFCNDFTMYVEIMQVAFVEQTVCVRHQEKIEDKDGTQVAFSVMDEIDH